MPYRLKVLILCIIFGFAIPSMAVEPMDGCRIYGCARELCIEAKNTLRSDIQDVCRGRDVIDRCYATIGECKRQADGMCGWTQKPELIACLSQQQKENDIQHKEWEIRQKAWDEKHPPAPIPMPKRVFLGTGGSGSPCLSTDSQPSDSSCPTIALPGHSNR